MVEGSVFARVHAMVLCDEIEDCPGEEDVFDLRGVRTAVRADSFPYRHPQLCIYLQVAGHEGMASGRVVIMYEATDEDIVNAPIDDVQLRGPLTLVPVLLWMRRCEFPAPGLYWFQVFLNQKLVAERRFHVVGNIGESNGQPTA